MKRGADEVRSGLSCSEKAAAIVMQAAWDAIVGPIEAAQFKPRPPQLGPREWVYFQTMHHLRHDLGRFPKNEEVARECGVKRQTISIARLNMRRKGFLKVGETGRLIWLAPLEGLE